MSLLSELKRRNVFKLTGAYLALGWVVLQGSSTLIEALRLPEWTSSLLLWLGLAGLPFVVLFAWVFEVTPEGVKRTTEIEPGQSITHQTSKRLDYIIIVMLAVAIAMAALDRFVPADSSSSVGAGPARDTSLAAPPTPGRGQGPLLQQETPALPADDKSIAVLPFVNMSSDKEQDYFSDGISEELLNLLAKIPELKVIARTSSFAFKGKEANIAEIASTLNVAHVLEGSVRKSGNKVRITAQLIRASDSAHLWSETYDRPLDDIFAVQDEISAAVVEQLKIKLLGEAPRAKGVNPEAYALYLQARQRYRDGSHEANGQAIALLQQALVLDPGYASAWSQLAKSYAQQGFNGFRPSDETYPLAREAANKALAIDPELASAHVSLGDILDAFDGDLATAAQHFQRALALEPSNSEVIRFAGWFARGLDRLDAAIALQELSSANDPLNAIAHESLGYTKFDAGRLDEAITSLRMALSLAPAAIGTHTMIGLSLVLKGETEAALAEIQSEPDEANRLVGLAAAYHALRKNEESNAVLAELIQKYGNSMSYNIASVLAFRGEADHAFEWLDKAAVLKDPIRSYAANDPFLANLHTDPRWLPFLRKLGRAPEQLAAIEFDVKLPR